MCTVPDQPAMIKVEHESLRTLRLAIDKCDCGRTSSIV
jgi:hypothetical protein